MPLQIINSYCLLIYLILQKSNAASWESYFLKSCNKKFFLIPLKHRYVSVLRIWTVLIDPFFQVHVHSLCPALCLLCACKVIIIPHLLFAWEWGYPHLFDLLFVFYSMQLLHASLHFTVVWVPMRKGWLQNGTKNMVIIC